MEIDGGCHCGEITYKAEVNPDNVIICHCTDCQTLSGGAFRTVVPVVEGTFVLLRGLPKAYVKTGESGNKREQAFCSNCGTHLYSAPPGLTSRVVALRVGSIRQRDQLIPKDQYWCRSSQKWLRDLSSIRRNEKQPTFDARGGFGKPTVD
jgi:hypothetical protein